VALELSTHDPANREQYAGSAEDWALAEATLARVLERSGRPFTAVPGEAAFYGPKIDTKARDVLGRFWQLSTIQFEFWRPKQFGQEYFGSGGQRHQPYTVHRALLGSVERFVALLIEHYKGVCTAWLAPVQVVVVPITDREAAYAADIAARLRSAGQRLELDHSGDRMANKIRRAEQSVRPPYILAIGAREAAVGEVAVRVRGEGDQGTQPLESFLARAQATVNLRLSS
jgi:threonyl-tRNA synthetase